MANVESKLGLLDTIVVKEISQMDKKFDFYQIGHPQVSTLYEADQSLTLEKTLALIDQNDPDLKDSPELGLLYGIAWEFVWGQRAPEFVTDLRLSVTTKAQFGLPLNNLEILWLNLILIDTDSF